MIQPIIEKSYLVEVNLGTLAAQKQINFQFIPQLQNAVIYSVQTFSASEIGTSPNGAAVVTAAGMASLTVTFAVGDNQDIFLYPCTDLRSPAVSGFQRMFSNKVFNLTKSYVTIQATTGLTANDSILFNFIYRNR
jgi:hypothetical protein